MPANDLLVQRILDNADTNSLASPDLLTELAAHINDLILHNFDGLVYLLYRVDVSENKLKNLLRENGKADAGKMIATLMIERQIQKIKSRLEHGRAKNNSCDEESW